jgi:hypothetical protein
VAFFEAKADLADRIAGNPGFPVDRGEARRIAWAARDAAERLRVEAADWSWC